MNKSSHLTCSILDIHLETSKETLTANILICILNAIFSLITFMENAVILHEIKKTQELHSPSFILLFCLAAADLLTGLVCQPFFVAYKKAELENAFNAYSPLKMIQTLCGWTTAGVCLVTLSGISVNRLVVRLNSTFTISNNRYCSSRNSDRYLHMDWLYNCCVAEVLVKKLAVFAVGNITFIISCYNPERLENFSPC